MENMFHSLNQFYFVITSKVRDLRSNYYWSKASRYLTVKKKIQVNEK